MKKLLLATSALVATAGFASAQGGGGVTVSGTAQMGVLGGDWVDDGDNDTSYELHTDIDVQFTMSGQTDTGLTFGASIDLDESDGSGSSTNTPPDVEGASAAFDKRTQGGEEIFISGAFGTLTIGDTDGALDWALQEIGIGGSLGDVHTTHAGYSGNGFVDSVDVEGDGDTIEGDGQIARYDYSFGNFALAISANISDNAAHEDVLAVGAKYNASLPAMELGIGVGYSQLGHEREEDDALGVSLDANFNNGFRAILNWVDMGDNNGGTGFRNLAGEQYIGVGLGYTKADWTVAANWGKYSEDVDLTIKPGQSGHAVVVNYDLGGDAEVQLGYANSKCIWFDRGSLTFSSPAVPGTDCADGGVGYSRISLGVAMSF